MPRAARHPRPPPGRAGQRRQQERDAGSARKRRRGEGGREGSRREQRRQRSGAAASHTRSRRHRIQPSLPTERGRGRRCAAGARQARSLPAPPAGPRTAPPGRPRPPPHPAPGGCHRPPKATAVRRLPPGMLPRGILSPGAGKGGGFRATPARGLLLHYPGAPSPGSGRSPAPPPRCRVWVARVTGWSSLVPDETPRCFGAPHVPSKLLIRTSCCS